MNHAESGRATDFFNSLLDKLITKYGALSPTIRFDDTPVGDEGEYNLTQMVFGPRPR